MTPTTRVPSRSSTADTPFSSERLRQAIDAGTTGSKIAAADPAAAPLGTDDEAADRPPSNAGVARATAEESAAGQRAGRPPRNSDDAPDDASYAGQSNHGRTMTVVVVIGLVSLLTAVAVFAMVFGS